MTSDGPRPQPADLVPKDEATRDEKRAAALYIASIATDVEDATHHLLAVLDLLPRTHPAVMRPTDHGALGYRLGCRCRLCRKAKAQADAKRRRKTTTPRGNQS
ncbi:putative protein OS=Streptomyces aurantiogriseus OX=66870 GN=GCM10010251_92240 PE=4 SV=1 [Streptomyces aurantiogriseus]